eukprot:947512-Amorphochlora_amoeboformis.AAC.2
MIIRVVVEQQSRHSVVIKHARLLVHVRRLEDVEPQHLEKDLGSVPVVADRELRLHEKEDGVDLLQDEFQVFVHSCRSRRRLERFEDGCPCDFDIVLHDFVPESGVLEALGVDDFNEHPEVEVQSPGFLEIIEETQLQPLIVDQVARPRGNVPILTHTLAGLVDHLVHAHVTAKVIRENRLDKRILVQCGEDEGPLNEGWVGLNVSVVVEGVCETGVEFRHEPRVDRVDARGIRRLGQHIGSHTLQDGLLVTVVEKLFYLGHHIRRDVRKQVLGACGLVNAVKGGEAFGW